MLPLQEAPVPSLIKELRSYMLHGIAEKNRRRKGCHGGSLGTPRKKTWQVWPQTPKDGTSAGGGGRVRHGWAIKPSTQYTIKLIDGKVRYSTDMGANFCHVHRMKLDTSIMSCIPSGTPMWNADISSFIHKTIVINMDVVGLSSFMTVHWPETNNDSYHE